MENEFKLKSGEYAKILGITKEALRSRRRRGELEGEYIFQNGINILLRAGNRPQYDLAQPHWGGLWVFFFNKK